MARAAKSRIIVEAEGDPGVWSEVKNGFSKVPDAEKWVAENISFGESLRVAKVSGVFKKTAQVVKR